MAYGLADLRAFSLRRPQVAARPIVINNNMDPVIAELRLLGKTVIDAAPLRLLPG